MKSKLQSFYKENPEIIEIAGISFVVSGLFLNISSDNTLISVGIKQIQVIFLIISSIILIVVLYEALRFFLGPVLMEKMKMTQTNEQIASMSKVIAITFFFLGLVVILFINLVIFILGTYTQEAGVLLITCLSYYIFYRIFKRFPTLITKATISFGATVPVSILVLFLLLLPLVAYFLVIWYPHLKSIL